MRTRFPGLDPRVRSRVLDVAQGNPLALLELPQALSDAQRSAREPLPSVLPLGQRLQELFTSRVMRLPPATRAILLTAALEAPGISGCWKRRAGVSTSSTISPRPSATSWYGPTKARAASPSATRSSAPRRWSIDP